MPARLWNILMFYSYRSTMLKKERTNMFSYCKVNIAGKDSFLSNLPTPIFVSPPPAREREKAQQQKILTVNL